MFTHPGQQHLTNQSHVVALVVPHTLYPAGPERSALFERAAQLREQTGCKVTLLHHGVSMTTEKDSEERLAFGILVNRINKHYGADFDSHMAFSGRTPDEVSQSLAELEADLLLTQLPEAEGEGVDTINLSLLASLDFPIWYVATNDEIAKVTAKILRGTNANENDTLTCHLAENMSDCLETEVRVTEGRPHEENDGDLIVTCVPAATANSSLMEYRRHQAMQVLASEVPCDLLIHRGCEMREARAAA